MEAHDRAALFGQTNQDAAWKEIAESKPSLAERHAARIFRNRGGGTSWYLQLFVSLGIFLWLLSRAEAEMNGPLLAVFFLLALNGTFTAWITAGYCELLVRVLAESRAREVSEAR